MRAYQSRLDSVVGGDGWRVSYRPWGERAVLCELTILGTTREDVGEAELEEPTRGGQLRPNPNVATGAVAQSFKRDRSRAQNGLTNAKFRQSDSGSLSKPV